MTGTQDPFEYDVALSYAEEDKVIAEELIRLLAEKDINVLRDEYSSAAADSWGKDMVDHLVNLYARKARYCVLFVSRHYPLQRWTGAERSSARERALRDTDEYILPIRLDETDVPGITETSGYRDLRQDTLESIADLLEGKLRETEERPGPPPQSHDLRSGNVPSQES